MKHEINVWGAHDGSDKVDIADVALDEAQVRGMGLGLQPDEVLLAARTPERVKNGHALVVAQQRGCEIAADESRRSGDDGVQLSAAWDHS
jgi:hypothetical protein